MVLARVWQSLESCVIRAENRKPQLKRINLVIAGGLEEEMGILKKIFGKDQHEPPRVPEHAVIVHFSYGKTDLQPIFDLEDELEAAINNAGVGEFDGNDIAQDGSDGSLYMYGPDADRLFESVRPVLESSNFIQGAIVTIRYGPPQDGVEEKEVKIGS